ncbi:LSM1 U6 small nuclear RNA associated [Fasciola gigantica]|uniref:U6 snRNA-associated Sm-like protein LSm1 n=1 Tax=Fasciola gigantica TaxID=46835 RepID=A0A504Y708_FASGI|nr:LSM1 U6 small nuclear RNA associated [Fasciola gigantica]
MLKRTYPGSASLFQDIGKKMIIYLRDSHIYIGYLRIIDQFGNIVIHQAVERVHVGKKFCDIHRGILIIRGENIILIGEVRSDASVEETLERVSEKEIHELQAQELASRKALARKRAQLFAERGLGIPDLSDLMLDDC